LPECYADTSFFYESIPSPFGDVGVVWIQRDTAPSVVRIFLPGKGDTIARVICREYPRAVKRSNRILGEMCNQIKEYMEGSIVKFSLELLDMGQCYNFQKNVLLKLRRIPRGKVVSYGQLAGETGAPGAARATGTALSGNPFPIILPCHRVVKSTGHPGHFGGGQELKEALLRIEGVEVSAGGKIEQRYFLTCFDTAILSL